MNQIRVVIDTQTVIPHKVLSDLGRQSLKEAVQDGSIQLSFNDLKVLWSRLQWTACNTAVVDKHLTAACNAICVFLRSASQSGVAQLKTFATSEQTWFQGFEVVHKAFGDGKSKPALQVLEMLTKMLCDAEDREAATATLRRVISQKMEIVFTGLPTAQLKEACTVLSFFLRRVRDIVPLAWYFSNYNSDSQLAFRRRCQQANINIDFLRDSPHNFIGHLLLALLLTTTISEPRTAAIKMFSLLCSRTDKLDYSNNIEVASLVIENYLHADRGMLKEFSADVLPAVLNDQDQIHRFLKQFDPSKTFSLSRLSIYLATLQVGRQKGSIDEIELPSLVNDVFHGYREAAKAVTSGYIGFRRLLMCDYPTIRLQAYHLLTYSAATNAVIPHEALQCLTETFKHLHDETDASYRGEYTSISRRFIQRLEKSCQAAQRSETAKSGSSTGVWTSYTTFLRAWNSFLVLELLPNISYPRHILAISILRLTLSLTPSITDILNPETQESLVSSLLSLVFDPFEDVRIQVSDLLISIASRDVVFVFSKLRSSNLIQRGQQVSASTNRADHADALGRLLMLQAHVNNKIVISTTRPNGSMAQESFSIDAAIMSLGAYLSKVRCLDPSSGYPLHGNVLGIAHTLRLSDHAETNALDQTRVDELFAIGHRVWMLVQDDLCVDSPETEVEEEELSESSGPKDLLAYSWRALRDSSLMMQALLDTVSSCSVSYENIGNLCFEQLAKLRHRGAFSTVAQTFYLCCMKSRTSNDNHGRQICNGWFEVEDQSLKLTRRSAGLPSIFAAILNPDDQDQFRDGIYRLASIANKEPSKDSHINMASLKLPQVHALNSIKDIMTNSRFSTVTEPLVVEMLNLAAKCLSSVIWAIRNCGLMLFRACINRLTPDSSNSFASYMPELNGVKMQSPLVLALQLLQQPLTNVENAKGAEDLEEQRSEIVFAALDLLSYIPSQPETYETIDTLIDIQLGSKVWAIREHAARLKTSRSPIYRCLQTLESIFPVSESTPSNALHGHLLCRRYMFNKCWLGLDIEEKPSRISRVMFHIDNLITVKTIQNSHPVVLAALFDWINNVFSAAIVDKISCESIVTASRRLRSIFTHNVNKPKSFLLRRAYALNCLYERLCKCPADIPDKEQFDLWESDIWREQDVVKYIVDELADDIPMEAGIDVFKLLGEAISGWDDSAIWTIFMLGTINYTSTSEIARSFSENDLARSLMNLDFRLAANRDLWNAKIRYGGLSVRLLLERDLSVDQIVLSNLLDALRLSQQDEIEASTRLHAVLAVADIVLFFGENGRAKTSGESERNRLCLTFILYDFLNDDDDEIREIAVNTTHKLKTQLGTLNSPIAGCAVAARQSILQLLSRDTNIEPGSVSAGACIRMLGIVPVPGQDDVGTLTSFCQMTPVRNIVEQQLQHASDLFAEERQNLYVDNIDQIDAWADVMHQCTLDNVETADLLTLVMWAKEGLSSLSKLIEVTLEASSPQDKALKGQFNAVIHPLGLTYDADFLVLFVRVITMAGLLRTTGQTKSATTITSVIDQVAITDLLQHLRTICSKHRVHQLVLTTIQKALAD